VNRRTFLRGAAAGAGIAALGGSARAGGLGPLTAALGIDARPARTPVQNLVVVMQENRSLNHFLGWYGAENPAFSGRQHATTPDLRAGPDGPMVPTEDWGQAGRANFHGRGFADPSHGWAGGRLERNGGACDGWLHPDTGNDELALSYYDALDVPVWAQLTRDYQTYDAWHASLLGPTQPNRYYLHSAQSAGFKNNDLPPEVAAAHPEWTLGWDWPTIWTLFETYGVSCAYYFNNLPELAFWGPRHLQHCRHISEYYAAAATGTLPQVSFIDPWFTTPEGLANDDHPLADIRLGQAFLSDVTEAFVLSPHYRTGALVITYDEWGGFWDDIDPPRLRDDRGTPADPGGDEDFGQLGFRIPSTIVSPWTRAARRVDHTVYEHASTLRFISENWNLPYLTMRHRSTNSIERAFHRFKQYDAEPAFVPYEAPLNVALEPTLEKLGVPGPTAAESSDLYRLAELGWFDKLPVRIDWRFEDGFLRSRPELLADAAALLSRPPS
jgi:phospholipase C